MPDESTKHPSDRRVEHSAEKPYSLSSCNGVRLPRGTATSSTPPGITGQTLGKTSVGRAGQSWIAEGSLLYLTPQENEQLVTTVAALSPSGSRLIVTLTPDGRGQRDDAEADDGRGWRNSYRVSDGPADAAAWLTAHGWQYEQPEHVGNMAIRYGRTPAPEDSPELPQRRLLIDARRQQ